MSDITTKAISYVTLKQNWNRQTKRRV